MVGRVGPRLWDDESVPRTVQQPSICLYILYTDRSGPGDRDWQRNFVNVFVHALGHLFLYHFYIILWLVCQVLEITP